MTKKIDLLKLAINKEYTAQRNLLVPDAVAYADKVCGKNKGTRYKNHEAWGHAWNKVYHTEMNILAKKAGLTG